MNIKRRFLKINFNRIHLKQHIVLTIGLLITFFPINGFIEVFVSNMSIATSVESRIKVAVLTFLGLGIIFNLFRNFFKKIFRVNNNSNIKKQLLLDSIFTFLFNFWICLCVYISSNATINQSLIGAFGSGTVGFLTGSITGYVLDLFTYLNSNEELKKFEKIDKKLKSKKNRKLGVFLMVLISSILTISIYFIKYIIS